MEVWAIKVEVAAVVDSTMTSPMELQEVLPTAPDTARHLVMEVAAELTLQGVEGSAAVEVGIVQTSSGKVVPEATMRSATRNVQGIRKYFVAWRLGLAQGKPRPSHAHSLLPCAFIFLRRVSVWRRV